ncbi:MAG: ABC transporter permease [Clostridiales bacterium]|nr:ABC transporter permease [Clostridiales bacterium]
MNLLIIRIKTFKKYSYLLFNFVKKDFFKKYRRSVLGVLWSVLNPLLMAAVVSTAFSRIFRIQTEHYPVYYLTGALIFNFMSGATSRSLLSMVEASGLIKKVYVPKYIFPLEKCLFELVTTVFSFLAVILVMPLLGVAPSLSALLFLVPIFYVLVFNIGLGMILSAVNVFFRDIEHLYAVLTQAWLFLTPVLYPVDALPESARWFLKINPMYYFIDYFRRVVMYGQLPDLRLNVICGVFSILFFVVGLIIFKKTQDKFILYV